MIEFKKMIDIKTTQLLTHKQTHTQTKNGTSYSLQQL